MANIIWNYLDEDKREYYLYLLKIFGSLSGLFKETEGVNGKKPYLYYRNHEIIFVKSFNADDLSRKDSAFDAVLSINNENTGIGLKTWIHGSDLSSQKVAEFNRNSSELRELFNQEDESVVVKRICELRNERIEDDIRRNATVKEVYHIVTRNEGVMSIIETPYEKIDINNISQINKDTKSVSFYDGLNHYNFNMSKTTLFKKFDVSQSQIIVSIPVEILEDPFLALESIYENSKLLKTNKEEAIILPLYNDDDYGVNAFSGFNASMGKSKVKDSGKPRPAYEAYAQIPVYIHYLYPNFFGFNALDKTERSNSKFTLHLPTGQKIEAKITQDNGKGLQSNPQSALGKWLLYNIFGLAPHEPLTRELIDRKGYDSIIIKKIDNKNFEVDLANYLAYEKWKIERKEQIEQLFDEGVITKRAIPKFRAHLFKDEN